MRTFDAILLVSCMYVFGTGCGSDRGAGEDSRPDVEERSAEGCWACEDSEFCIIIQSADEDGGLATDTYFCVEDPCEGDGQAKCECQSDIAEDLHPEDCTSSCQYDSQIVYCAKRGW